MTRTAVYTAMIDPAATDPAEVDRLTTAYPQADTWPGLVKYASHPAGVLHLVTATAAVWAAANHGSPSADRYVLVRTVDHTGYAAAARSCDVPEAVREFAARHIDPNTPYDLRDLLGTPLTEPPQGLMAPPRVGELLWDAYLAHNDARSARGPRHAASRRLLYYANALARGRQLTDSADGDDGDDGEPRFDAVPLEGGDPVRHAVHDLTHAVDTHGIDTPPVHAALHDLQSCLGPIAVPA
jgi:hypothetical protein